MSSGGFLFASGGTDIPGIGGQKWLRRFLLSSVLGIIAFYSSLIWWKALAMAISFVAVLSLPYGDRTPWWGRILVACSYSLPSLWIGTTPWQLVLPAVFLILFWLSRINKVAWKVVEFICGVLIAITIISAV